MDDIERLLARQADADDDATRRPGEDDPGAPCLLGKTVAVGTYPTAAARFFWITPHDVTGAEVEGGAGTLTGSGGNVLALNVGANLPAAGTAVVCTFVAHRWVFSA